MHAAAVGEQRRRRREEVGEQHAVPPRRERLVAEVGQAEVRKAEKYDVGRAERQRRRVDLKSHVDAALAQLVQNGRGARVRARQLGLGQQRRGGELDLLAKAAAQRERIRQVAVADGEDAQAVASFTRHRRRRGTFRRR